MKRTKTIVIVKRDGTLERFSLPKLRSCLARVMQLSAGSAELADPLARAVGLHLRECRPHEMPASEYLYRCARSVLRQTGLGEAARLLAAHRRLREARRRRVRVFDPLDLEQSPLRWRKGNLVATLQNVYDLRQSVARFLAGRIEEQVFGLGYRLVSKPFLAELVRNEVLAWGLVVHRAPNRQRSPARGEPLAGGQARKEN